MLFFSTLGHVNGVPIEQSRVVTADEILNRPERHVEHYQSVTLQEYLQRVAIEQRHDPSLRVHPRTVVPVRMGTR